MTGKAGTLANKIHFESGTLKAFELDPLGTSLRYDDQSGGYVWGKASKPDPENPVNPVDSARANSALGTALYALERLNEIDPDKEEGTLRAGIQQIVEDEMNRARHGGAEDLDVFHDLIGLIEKNDIALEEEDKEKLKTKVFEHYDRQLRALTATPSIVCDNGTPAKRGFQILGPEGWRTFDQEERLVMAMSSSASPLTGVLKELAQRVKASRESETGLSLVLLKEHYRLLHA